VGDKGYFDRFFRERGEWTFPKFFDFSDFDFLESLYSLCARSRTAENAETVFRGAVEMLCGELAEKVPLEKRRENKQAAFVCEVLRYAETHTAEDLSLSAVSTAFGYSGEHLSRLMKKYLRESWNGYVNRLRAVKADRLLKEGGEENVLKIAYECGFDSPSTFYRAYKREFGKTPKQ
jgi:AraC-like DNA-binding protein